MKFTRRQFNASSITLLSMLAVPPAISKEKTNAKRFNEKEYCIIENIVNYFTQYWGGETITLSTVKYFINVKLDIDNKYYEIYQSLINHYRILFNTYHDNTKAVTKLLSIANDAKEDSHLKLAAKELLQLYITRTGYQAYGLLNINGHITRGYLDQPTPYRTINDDV
ncbi:hypothetical protein [Zooshikella harenae]|uniref:Uncharacterized protein n=1 Tax=Zooshikella harenae TaxID=2827238 RepID=A0ABS5ZF92_9GAMM|nr:hypothetical protein [Zooshikella harenae]MBU2712428.1 hypothetical protein [Zooshikella harenae]